MSREADIERLVNRIKDYRKNEIQFVPDARHINKWLSQFSPMTQDVILHETVHIFDDWYFTNEFVDEKIDRIPNYLLKKHSYPSISSVFQNVSFLCTQKDGKSQNEIVSRFRNRIFEDVYKRQRASCVLPSALTSTPLPCLQSTMLRTPSAMRMQSAVPKQS